MKNSLNIGIIGDFDNRISQKMTNQAIEDVVSSLSENVEYTWIATGNLKAESIHLQLKEYNGIWSGPGEYENSPGVLNAIRYCRENNQVFIGT